MPNDAKLSAGEASALDSFLKAVVKSGLLDAAQLQAVREAAPAEARNDARHFAEHLVKCGRLTRFQAGKLLKGVSLGLVFGYYHILSPLGRGGMGSVFLARDSRSELLVAVKVLPPKQAKAKERLLARFRREMDICQRVSHPNLTRTFEVGEQLGINFIAMEFIPGRDLYHLVREKGPLTVERAARLFSEVAAGLEHAHTMGLIHRDMKPSNIMVLPDDHAKVLDLGLALMAGAREPTILANAQGALIGTPDYMAPEQGEDPLKVDTRSDIYALGCTLYYALTGQPPFPGGGGLQKMVRHKVDPPPPLAKLNPKVPTGFANLIMRMMAKQPDQRFQSAEEVRAALLLWCQEPGKPESERKSAEAKLMDPAPLAILLEAPKPAPAVEVKPTPKPALAPEPKPAAPPMPAKPAVVPAAAAAPVKPAAPEVKTAPAAVALAPPADAPQFPPPVPELRPRPALPASTPAPAAPAVAEASPVDNGASAASAAPIIQTSPAEPRADLPFLIDFGVPVVVGSLVLIALWIVGLLLLLRSGGS